MSKILLQVLQGLMAAVALYAGAHLLIYGLGFPGVGASAAANMPIDNTLRFVGGIWLGVGLLLGYGLHRMEDKGPLLRAAWAIVFCGGLGRCVSLFQIGYTDTGYLRAAAMEVCVPPLLAYWQHRVARRRA